VIIKACGYAVGNAIRLSEMLRHGFEGVYAKNELETRVVQDVFKPRDPAMVLDEVVREKRVTGLTITLSPTEQAGFIPPPPSSEITLLKRELTTSV
jgi:hypothetical protein